MSRASYPPEKRAAHGYIFVKQQFCIIRLFLLLFDIPCGTLNLALPVTVSPKHSLGMSEGLLPSIQEGGLSMVTYPDLIQIGILIVGICNLVLQIYQMGKKK